MLQTLQDPGFSAVVAFRSRNVRGGGIFANGQAIDADVPVIYADIVGSALVAGQDALAFTALSGGPSSTAELRSGGVRFTRMPMVGGAWQAADSPDVVVRLPDILMNVSAAEPVVAPPGQDGHWFAVHVARDVGPGIMWDTTRVVYPVIEDERFALRIAADDHGTPLAACLLQSWWQEVDAERPGIGEEAWLLSAIRFDRVGSAPSIPTAELTSTIDEVPALDLDVPVPEGRLSE